MLIYAGNLVGDPKASDRVAVSPSDFVDRVFAIRQL
jgi:hypothetical protein